MIYENTFTVKSIASFCGRGIWYLKPTYWVTSPWISSPVLCLSYILYLKMIDSWIWSIHVIMLKCTILKILTIHKIWLLQILNNCTADSSICVFYRNVNNYVAFFAWLFYFIHSKNLVLCRKKGYHIDYLWI